MRAVLKINSASVRRRLKEVGLSLCICCEFEDSVWLTVYKHKIHGVGYLEDLTKIEEELARFEEENKYIDFGYNVEEFIKFCKDNINNN